MSKPPKRKNRKHKSPEFYEALPASTIAPAGLPQVGDQLQEAIEAIDSRRRDLTRRAEPYAERIKAAVAGGLHAASVALNSGTQAFRNYVPAAGADLGAWSARMRQRFFNRRARALYLLIASSAAFVFVAVIGVVGTATIKAYANDISSPAALLAKKKTGTTILDRNGTVLFQGYGAQSTEVVSLKDMPTTLKDATLAAEDPDFYSHPAISWRGTARAIVADLTHASKVEGGSTLTQQLVKNSLLTTDKNFTRKFNEMILATELERQYSKDQILEMYLNETYYGQGSSGVEAASEAYFHKSVKELTLGESALLAGLPLGPSRFDPNASIENATGRRDFVLSRMVDLGKITQEQADAAKAQPLDLGGSQGGNTMAVYPKSIIIRAPHFVFYVLDQLRAKYGQDVLENGGITVHTTLDLKKQELAEQTVKTQINKLSEHNVTNAGLVSLEPKTGDIVAMVGSVDYNAPGFGNVNVVLSQLQPGSSFKPIAYATAFKKGWNGSTIIKDEPFSAPSGDGTSYQPMNYDLKWHGNVTVRKALDNSFNIPAVKALQFAGIPDTIKTAHDMGITSLNQPERYGLSLVLGGGEVRPIDMATVYSTFANNGTKVLPRAILKVEDRSGKDISKLDHPAPVEVLDPRIAYMITSILSDDHSRQPEFPANGPLTLPGRPAAAKTGTTNDFRDNWTVGYTPQLVTAVWVGNNNHSAMNNIDGITGAAPIWHDYMKGALEGVAPMNFPQPAGITMAKACSPDGIYTEAFKSDAVPPLTCNTPRPTDKPKSDDNKATPEATTDPKADQPGQGDGTNSSDATPTPATPSPTPTSSPAPPTYTAAPPKR